MSTWPEIILNTVILDANIQDFITLEIIVAIYTQLQLIWINKTWIGKQILEENR